MSRRVVLAVSLLVVLACSPGSTEVPSETPATATPPGPEPAEAASGSMDGPLYGFALSPRSYQAGDMEGFFETVTQAGNLVSWAGDWSELEDEGSAAGVVMELSDHYGYTPLIAVGPPGGGRAPGASLRGPPVNRVEDGIVRFVERYRPPYLALGVEMNLLWETDPEGFDRYVELFEETAERIHRRSPDTRVFPAFQLERLRGLRGGVFGDPGSGPPAWELLDRFPSADLMGFTTYPGLIYGDPEEVPSDYYAVLRDRVDRPVAVIETGWQAGDAPPGFEGDPEEQARFVERLFELAEPLAPEMVVWLHLYDQPGVPVPFDSMGLFDRAGEPRPAWDVWLRRVGG